MQGGGHVSGWHYLHLGLYATLSGLSDVPMCVTEVLCQLRFFLTLRLYYSERAAPSNCSRGKWLGRLEMDSYTDLYPKVVLIAAHFSELCRIL